MTLRAEYIEEYKKCRVISDVESYNTQSNKIKMDKLI